MDTTSESYAIFCGLAGAASSLALAGAGAAYGTARSFRGIAIAGTNDDTKSGIPQVQGLQLTNLIPIVMAGVLAIYGLIYAVIAASQATSGLSTSEGYSILFGGLSVGLCCLFSGIAIGVCGEAGIIATAKNPNLKVTSILTLIYCEAIGLYGLIIGLILQGAQYY